MMKRYFLLLTLLSFSLLFEAKEVSYNEALQKASEFFTPASSSKKQVKALNKQLSLATTFKQVNETNKPAFYIINNGQNGFVIVSADDNAKTILGYSDKGAFDADSIPSNVKFWLDYYAQQISSVAQKSISKPLYATGNAYDPIAPLLGTIEHDQNEPYNDLCPTVFGSKTPTGCAATAAGQIMTLYKYPAKGKGSADYNYQLSDGRTVETVTCQADFSKSTYDWSNILDKYEIEYEFDMSTFTIKPIPKYNTNQGDAVSLLLRDIGYASQMTYQPGGSGTSDQDVAAALVNNFSYDKSLKRVAFNMTLDREKFYWQLEGDMMEDLYAELKAGRPVFCAGTDENGQSGHAFVCDGIQSDGKLHINWGWAGEANGYYELTAFIPTSTGTGAGMGQYTNNISFLVNIQRDKGTSEIPAIWGVGGLEYVPTTNEFAKNTTDMLFFEDNSGFVFNLGYKKTELYFSYSIYQKESHVNSSYARWVMDMGWFGEIERDGKEYGPGSYLPGGDAIQPKISTNNLVSNVSTGAYDLYFSAMNSKTSNIGYPVYIKNRGKVKNKIAVGKDNVYIYPASTNYSRNNTPTNLTATKNGSTYTLSWTGNASNYILLTWDEDDLTVEKLSSKTKSGVSGGKNWAVFACETSSSVTYATSDIGYGDVLPVISDEPEKKNIKVTKVWEDNDNQDGLRTTSVTIKLLADSKDAGKTVTLNESNSWTSTFSNLDAKASGKDIAYTVEESSVPSGYTPSVSGTADATTGFTITNTHTPETKNIKVTKVWEDNDNQDGLRTTSVTIKLLADGKDAGKTVTLNESNSWTGTFSDLDAKSNGKDIVYTVEEPSVPTGYTCNVSGTADEGFTITNTYTATPAPETKSIKVTKVWDDNNDQDGLRTTSVTIKLLADGKDAGKTVTLNESNSWTSTFSDLDAKANGKAITYTVEEPSVPTGYTCNVSGTADEGFTITNTHTPAPTPTPETKSVKVTKVWDDNNNQDGLRTTSVTIKLLADGKDAGKTVTLNESNSWTSTFTNLDANANGKDIVYTVEESSVPTGYTRNITGTADATTGFTITNTHTPETKSIKVTKVWDDNNNQDGLRTTSVTIKLLADGKDAGKTVTLNESNSWTSTFTNLDAQSNGKDIVYTVEESSVPTGYTPSVSGTADATTGFTITNTHTPETKNIKVTKVWNDNDNQDGLRTTSVTIKLLADGKDAGKTVTLNESNSWTSTFSDLDAKANGKDIVYTVEESSVPTGYTSSVSGTADATTGFTITNTHTPAPTPTPETKSIKVTKVWDDNNNQDGLRTTNVTIKLLADGKDAGKTVTLNESNSWTSTFSNLDAQSNGKDIVYTVEESSVPTGYTRNITGTADATTGFTITNTHTPETKSVKVTKVWDDNNDQDGLRTTSVTVKLFADGREVKSEQLSASNGWTYTFTNLDAKANGKNIKYTVEEASVPKGYKRSITGTADAGFTITNTHSTTETKNVRVRIVWDDNSNRNKLRPSSLTIKLLADGRETGKTVILKATNHWIKSFTDLEIQSNGKNIVYTIEEIEIPEYTVTIAEDGTNGFIITNTLISKNDEPDDTPTDVEDVDADKVVISTHHLTIHVKAPTSSAIQIYTVSGDMLYSAQRTQASFMVPHAGVYIVQVGDEKHKVLVR